MTIPKDITNKYLALNDWAIMVCYRGSLSHGTWQPSSEPTSIDDKDVLAVCVPTTDYYFGLREFGSRGTQEIKQDEWDIVAYEARKMFSMLTGGNPNVLMTLWLKPQYYLKITSPWQMVIDNRDMFVAKHVYRSFTGYAHGQLHRMTHMAFEGYMGQKRKALVEQFGYDTKNASHLVRILRMGIEFLTDGVLYVERHDAPQLLEIKRGEWTLEQVKAEADRLFKLAEEVYTKSSLPKEIDRDAINDLCADVVASALQERGEL